MTSTWAQLEYGDPDGTSFIELMEQNVTAWSTLQTTDPGPRRLMRTRDFITPTYGYSDELRVVARQGSVGWGALALFRGGDEARFTAAEAEFVGSLSSDVRGRTAFRAPRAARRP